MKRLDPTWLAHEYIDQRTSQARLAEVAGVSVRTIRYQLRAAGIGRRPRIERPREPARQSWYPLLNDRDELERRIVEGATLYRLASELGCNRTAVRGALKRHGIDYEQARLPYSSA